MTKAEIEVEAEVLTLSWQGQLFERLYGDDNIATWQEVAGAQIIDTFKEEGDATKIGIVDLSPLPRTGAKGGEWDFLPKDFCPQVNNFAQTESGALIARLGADELLCLPAEDGSGLPKVPDAIALPRRDSHFCFGLCGEEVSELMARLCQIPPPAKDEVLQTIVGGIDGVLLPVPGAGMPAFYWLGDSGFAVYAWYILKEMTEKLRNGGGVLGWDSWQNRNTVAAD